MLIRPIAFAAMLTSALVFADFATGSAQSKTASIAGRVLRSFDSLPVSGARVILVNERRKTETDSLGRFTFESLEPGSYRVEANLIGFPPLTALVTVNEGEHKDVEFRSDSLGQLLPTIFVEGEPRPELVRVMTTFERRMSTGHGRFITREEIERRNPHQLMDMIRFLPGVRSDCRGFTCQIKLNHSRSGCGPAVFVDDQRTTLAVLDNTPPSAVEGIEVYRGPSETPPELNNEDARCGGAIAIWTKRGKRHER